MVDKRELILLRLFEVLKSIPTLNQWVRNRGELPDEKRPAIIMLDGDEHASETAFNRGRIGASPNMISLVPEVYISLEARKPDNVNTGEDLSAIRVAILKAVLTDSVLLSLVGGNGEIRYNGCVTDLARGRNIDGEMGLMFAFVYHFKPSEL